MSKAEKFIQEYTRNCSNELLEIENTFVGKMKVVKGYQPWLTLDDARKAVEIAREEIYEWLRKVSFDDYKIADEESYRIGCPYDYIDEYRLINDLKQVMKDE